MSAASDPPAPVVPAAPAATPEAVIAFWCDALGPAAWFKRDEATDRLIGEHCGTLHRLATDGVLAEWADTPAGALALVILFDQVSRNLYRDDPRAYATDEQARAVARRALARGDDAAYDDTRRALLLLPFEHSEWLADQQWSVALFDARIGNPQWRDYAWRHHDVIARFGRFPHRNAVLGRSSTAEEAAYLAEHPEGF